MVVAQEKFQWQEPLKQKSPGRNSQPARKDKKFSKGKRIIALTCIVGLIGAIGAATIQLTVVRGAEVRNLEREISTIKMQNDLLQMEVDKLRAVGRIEREALAMGMEKPAGTIYVAGAVPSITNQKAVPSTQTATSSTEVKPSALQQFSKIFSSLFAST